VKKITVTDDDGTETTYPSDHLLTRAEVAALFGVDPGTVSRWGASGKLTSVCTVGGHRRYLAGEVAVLLAASRRVRQP
jgi:predicted site-specific integrase-resolvase